MTDQIECEHGVMIAHIKCSVCQLEKRVTELEKKQVEIIKLIVKEVTSLENYQIEMELKLEQIMPSLS